MIQAPKKFSGLLFAVWLSGSANAAPPEIPSPDIDASAWVLMDHASGQALAARHDDKALAPASLTKLMTAYVLFEKLKSKNLRLEEKVEISPRAAGARGARLFLRPGTTARVEELLQGMIVASANDATLALAEHAAGSEAGFAAEMNAAAQALGLNRTRFVNATGQDAPDQASTARDLARLTSALIRDFPEYYKWFGQKQFTHLDLTHYNHNALLWRDVRADGVKTGHTRDAGHCLSASAERDGMRLIAIVLGAEDDGARVDAGQKLLEHGFRHFETRLLYAAGVPALQVRIWLGDRSQLPLGVGQNLYLTLPRGWHEKLHARLWVPQEPTAPVRRGQVLGRLALELDRQPYAEYPLVALREIEAGNLFERAIDRVQLWLQ